MCKGRKLVLCQESKPIDNSKEATMKGEKKKIVVRCKKKGFPWGTDRQRGLQFFRLHGLGMGRPMQDAVLGKVERGSLQRMEWWPELAGEDPLVDIASTSGKVAAPEREQWANLNHGEP